MTTFRKNVLTALAALSMGAAALGAHAQSAQQSGASQDGRHAHAVTKEQRAEHAARRVARLHDELKITPAQENAWNTFVATMKPQARGERGGEHMQRPDRAARAKLSAPERMAKHIEMQKQRTAAMEQRLGALNSFYAVLTPEQKKTFDEKAARFQGRFGGHGGHRGGWQHRGGDTARG
jgi:Spy/CpxP family protein refolding chaperone